MKGFDAELAVNKRPARRFNVITVFRGQSDSSKNALRVTRRSEKKNTPTITT